MDQSEFDEAYDDEDDGRHEREERRLGQAILNGAIRELEPKTAVAVSETTSIEEAIRLMVDRDIGAVLVVKDGRVAGIFTERDVLRRVVLSGVDRVRPVVEVMTGGPETLEADDAIAFALNLMVVGGFRHVPLVNDDGTLEGMVSVRDVVEFIDSLLPGWVRNLPPEPRHAARTNEGG